MGNRDFFCDDIFQWTQGTLVIKHKVRKYSPEKGQVRCLYKLIENFKRDRLHIPT